MKIFFHIALCCLCLFAACIPEPVDIDIEQAEPRLVVSSQMLNENLVLINVSRSFGALEFSEQEEDSLSDDFLAQILADSARVVLTHNGLSDTLPGIGQGFYLSFNTELVENELYQLAVYDSATGLEVFSESQVLRPAVWDSLAYEFQLETFSLFDTSFNDTTLQLRVRFEDFSDENYYMLNAYRLSQT
ncbi:MAG: DUF4249 family protein, partial [Bacteroidota bacterium]